MNRPPQAQYPDHPGSKAWIEHRHGRVAGFADRIVPALIDIALAMAIVLVLVGLGAVLLVAGIPQTHDCGPYGMDTCEVPGTGNGLLITLAVVMFMLSFFATLAFICWNRIWRVHRTGQSLGKTFCHLRVIDAVHGTHPALGPAVLRELIHQLAGPVSWLWIAIDDDDRTLADIVGSTHVVHVRRSSAQPAGHEGGGSPSR